MIKKILVVLLVVSSMISICSAAETPSAKKVIGVFLEAPLNYENNSRAEKLIMDKTNKLFFSDNFIILPTDATALEMRTYREDNHLLVDQYSSQFLTRAQILTVSKNLSCDYALFITLSNETPDIIYGFFSKYFKTNVTCDLRLLDVRTGRYLFTKKITKEGANGAPYTGVPSFDTLYNNVLEKTLKALVIDTSSLE